MQTDTRCIPRRQGWPVLECGEAATSESRMDIQSIDQLLDPADRALSPKPMRQPGSDLVFEQAVIEACSYLQGIGFEVSERCPTLVRYVCQNVEVDIYQGRQSFEVGVGVSIDGERFSLSELIRLGDPKMADAYRSPVATDADGVVSAVSQVALLLRQFGALALRGDVSALAALTAQRQQWSETFALDVLVEQTRPLAERAFRNGDYSKAAELYARIRPRLSPAEKGKLALAEERSATRH